MKRTAVIPAALVRLHSLHLKEEKIMHCSDATFNYAPNPTLSHWLCNMHNSTCTSACRLMSKINFMTPRTCKEQSFYSKRCFNPCYLNGLGRDETSYMSNRSLICTRSAGYIYQSQNHSFAEHVSLNSRYRTDTLPNATAIQQLWFLKESKQHKSWSCDRGQGQQIPWITHSKRSRSCRQGLEALQKMDVNRNVLPKILRVYLWSNSFQVSVVLADILQSEPSRIQSSQSGSKESKVQAPGNLSLPNYQSNLILVQNYILFH